MRIIRLALSLWATLLLQPLLAAQQLHLTPTQLRTNFREAPRNVEGTPVFGWTFPTNAGEWRGVQQTAYRLRVAASPAGLRQPGMTIWNSGRVASSVFWQRPYAGPPLHSAATYYWQVQSWMGSDAPGPWSTVASFTTGLHPSDWQAKWIAAEPDTRAAAGAKQLQTDPPPLAVFRKKIQVHKPVAGALLFVSGLGQYEVHLNGRPVTDTVLNPGWTYYGKTVPYDSYDVTALLHPGANAIGVLLGNGMYNVQDVKGHYTKFAGSFGQPKCLLQLQVHYVDGTFETFVTDRSWQTHAGPVLYSSTYGGETYDGSALPSGWDGAHFAATNWSAALEVGGPGGMLSPDQAAPMVATQSYKPIRITHPRPGVAVYDLGQNMSGWPEVEVSGKAGASVTLLPGELLDPDGTVSQRSAHAFPENPVLFRYRVRGGKTHESWHPRFAYYSFRYVQVTTSSPDGEQPTVHALTGRFVHAKAPQVGEFHSSNELFQQIHTLIDRAVLSNLASVVTDCPSREKLGWLEETYLNASTLMLNYDVTALYEKMSADMRDSQLPSGLVPSIAPEYVAFVDAQGRSNAFRDSPEWGSAVILSPWALYQHTGDIRPLAENYEVMQDYMTYLHNRSAGKLLAYGLGDWYDIGPKEPGPSQLTSKDVTASGVYYEDMITMVRIAELLGHPDDAAHYRTEADAFGKAYNTHLFHPDTNQYDTGSQTANAIPLALGLVPQDHVPRVLANLVADIHAHQDHITSGDVGFHYVVRALTDYGRSDVLAALFSRRDAPSYGYQIDRGATTLTEAWDANPRSSQNHFMLGHGEEWFYRGLAGLSIDMARGAQDAVQLRPSFLPGVDAAKAAYQTTMGRFALAWQRSNGRLSVDVTVPVGARAHILLAGQHRWQEGVVPAARARGVSSPVEVANGLNMALGSGTYHFVALEGPGDVAMPTDTPHF